MARPDGSIIFRRVLEPNEKAFRLRIPDGWVMEGGIQRADHMTQQVSAQSIEAKVDFAIKSDAAGRAMIRWCPTMKYCDMRYSPAGQMGMFPPGSNYAGMVVWPLMGALQYLSEALFPWAHPMAQDAQIVEQRPLPEIAQKYQQRLLEMVPMQGVEYDAAIATYSYVEDGVRYRERAFTVIENLGPMAAGMWSNKETLYLRAAADEFDRWEPVLSHIHRSVQLNPKWIQREMKSQKMLTSAYQRAQQAGQRRDRQVARVQQQVQSIDRQIAQHHQRTNAEIHNDMYLTLTDQEEYMNPYTNKVDTGSNQWQHRWVTEAGDELYTDEETIDPNLSDVLNRSDWKRSAVRPRFPQ